MPRDRRTVREPRRCEGRVGRLPRSVSQRRRQLSGRSD